MRSNLADRPAWTEVLGVLAACTAILTLLAIFDDPQGRRQASERAHAERVGAEARQKETAAEAQARSARAEQPAADRPADRAVQNRTRPASRAGTGPAALGKPEADEQRNRQAITAVVVLGAVLAAVGAGVLLLSRR